MRLALYLALLQHAVAHGAAPLPEDRARLRREANRLDRIRETYRRPVHIAAPTTRAPNEPDEPDEPDEPWTGTLASMPVVPRGVSRAAVCVDADWRGLAANEKTGRGLACATQVANGTFEDAVASVRVSRRWVVDSWRAGNTTFARAAVWRAAPDAMRARVQTLTRLAAFVEQTPAASADAIVAEARSLLKGARIAFDDIDTVYARQLWLDVDDWLDVAALRERRWSPVETLGHAYRWCGLDLAVDLSPGYAAPGPFDRCASELAAVLHGKARGVVPDLASLTGFAAVGAEFARELHCDLSTRAHGVAVLPISASAPNVTRVWFDGSALHGAAGMNLTELTGYLASHAAPPHARGDSVADAVSPRCRRVALGREDREALLRMRLHVLHENTDYRFGTPHQSLATTVLRLGPLHGVGIDNLGHPETLVERYHVLEAAWEAAPRYPVAPHLVAAFHLARSSDVLIHDGSPIEPQMVERVRRAFAPAIDASGRLPAVRAWLAGRRLVLWADLPALAQRPDLASAPRALREATDEYRRLLALPEQLAVPAGEAGARALSAYLAERLVAYGAVPTASTVPTGHRSPSSTRFIDATLAIMRARTTEMQRLHRHKLARQDAGVAAPRQRRAASAHPGPFPGPAPGPAPVPGSGPGPVAGAGAFSVPVPGLANPADPAGLADARHALTRALIISRLVEQTEEGEVALIDFVPFAGSIYTLGKGLWERDAKLALRGAFGFSIDVLFVWVGGATERMVARQAARLVSEVGLTPHEPRALAMLAELGEVLDVTRPGELPAGNVVVNTDPCGVERLAEVPPARDAGTVAATPGEGRSPASSTSAAHGDRSSTRSVPAPAADARTGSGFSLDGALTRRSMEPVEGDTLSTGSASWRFPASAPGLLRIGRGASWEGAGDGFLHSSVRRRPSSRGKVVRMHSARTGRTLSRNGSHGGATATRSTRFLERATVARTREFIRARDFIERIRSDAFSVAMPQISELLHLETGVATETQHDFQIVRDTLQALCESSQTLRALMRAALKAHPKSSSTAPPFSLRFMKGAPPRCDLQRNLIVLPRVAQRFDTRYVDARGVTPFQRERAWLHELVHALTGIEDVGSHERLGHRGAVVYFTDRILFEAGPGYPERVMYQHAKGAFASGHARAPDPVIDAARQEAVETALAEDTFLDTLLRRRMKWGGAETILGTPVEQRLTVIQVRRLRQEIEGWMGDEATLRLHEFLASLRHIFRVSVNAGSELGAVIARGTRFVRLIEKAYREDDFICFLMNRWYVDAGRQPEWSVRWSRHPLPYPARGWSVNRETRSLVLYEEPLFHASQQGPRLLDDDRRLAGALIELITPATEAMTAWMEPHLNRGLRVYLENRVMALSRPRRRGDPDPLQRISAQWTHDAASLWPSIGKARRAAEAEDAWLTKNVT
ncbi:MAG: PipA/GogA/GtgA family type III secretion system effector [Janthinobacterium lividum]